MSTSLQNQISRAANEARALVKWLSKVRGSGSGEPIVLHDMSFPNGSTLIAHCETLEASEKPEHAVRHIRKCVALYIKRIKKMIGAPSQRESRLFRHRRAA